MKQVVFTSGIAEPERNVHGRISTEPHELWGELATIAVRFRLKLHWNYGSGPDWRVIVAAKTELDVSAFLTSSRHVQMAREMLAEIGRFVVSEPELRLFVELDSDERVDVAEGWFFRIKSDPAPDREFTFLSRDFASC